MSLWEKLNPTAKNTVTEEKGLLNNNKPNNTFNNNFNNTQLEEEKVLSPVFTPVPEEKVEVKEPETKWADVVTDEVKNELTVKKGEVEKSTKELPRFNVESSEPDNEISDPQRKRRLLSEEGFKKVKSAVQEELSALYKLEDFDRKSKDNNFKLEVQNNIENVIESMNLALTKKEKMEIVKILVADSVGLGPIEPLLEDPTISEVMVNSKDQVYVERNGKLVLTDIKFDSDQHIRQIIDRILSPLNRHVDETSPYVDARLLDGSRVNAIIPPLAIKGPCVTIRKFSKDPLQVSDLVAKGTITESVAKFLEACVKARLNIVVSGGTGSGKTTTLNVLSSFIPSDERIVTVEDAAELQLRQEHVITLEARPAGTTGAGEVTIRDLVKNCLRMRPDRIIVGECRSGEALDMLQAMNTGHDGSMTTGHSNSPRDMLARLETMVLMSGMDLPLKAIREQIASAIQLIVQQSRMKDGTRKITYITEVQNMEGDVIVLQDLFLFKQTGYDSDGKIVGSLEPTGMRPMFMDVFEAYNIKVDPEIFFKSKAH